MAIIQANDISIKFLLCTEDSSKLNTNRHMTKTFTDSTEKPFRDNALVRTKGLEVDTLNFHTYFLIVDDGGFLSFRYDTESTHSRKAVST